MNVEWHEARSMQRWRNDGGGGIDGTTWRNAVFYVLKVYIHYRLFYSPNSLEERTQPWLTSCAKAENGFGISHIQCISVIFSLTDEDFNRCTTHFPALWLSKWAPVQRPHMKHRTKVDFNYTQRKRCACVSSNAAPILRNYMYVVRNMRVCLCRHAEI